MKKKDNGKTKRKRKQKTLREGHEYSNGRKKKYRKMKNAVKGIAKMKIIFEE